MTAQMIGCEDLNWDNAVNPVPPIIFAATGVLVQYHHCFACMPQLATCTLHGFVYMLHP